MILYIEWYLLSFLMIINYIALIYFYFTTEVNHGEPCKFGFESGFEFELEIGTGMFGSVDLGGSTTRCQCYQHKWLFLLVVRYSTIL